MKRCKDSLTHIINSYMNGQIKQTRKMINSYGKKKFIKDVINDDCSLFEDNQSLKDSLVLTAIEN